MALWFLQLFPFNKGIIRRSCQEQKSYRRVTKVAKGLGKGSMKKTKETRIFSFLILDWAPPSLGAPNRVINIIPPQPSPSSIHAVALDFFSLSFPPHIQALRILSPGQSRIPHCPSGSIQLKHLIFSYL